MRLPTITTRRLMIAVAVVAVALSVEGAVTVIAGLVLLRAVRRPRPVGLTTAILLTLLTGIWLWANLRSRGYEEFADTPTGLDPFTKGMFWRGWPLSPFMICEFRHMQLQTGGFEGCVLVFDAVLFVAVLFAAKAVCESLFRRLAGWTPAADPGAVGNGRPTQSDL